MKTKYILQNSKLLPLMAISVLLFGFISSKEITYKNLDANNITYFHLEANSKNSVEEPWVVSFHKTTIEARYGVQILDKNFDEVTTAPTDGYLTDKKASLSGSGKSWYKYYMSDHSIRPLPEKTIVIKTAKNQFVKMEILSYYHEADGNSGFYTFRYAFIK